VDEDHRNSFYHWELLFVGLKGVLVEFQCVGHYVFNGLPFAWRSANDVINFFYVAHFYVDAYNHCCHHTYNT
jgi:hypothetical protein